MKKLKDYNLHDLIDEVEVRFGKDWMNAEIEEEGYPFSKYNFRNGGLDFTYRERKPTHQLCCGWDESDPIQR